MDHFSATSQRPIFAKFGHDTWIVVKTQILGRNLHKLSIKGSFAPKSNLEGGQSCTSLRAGYRSGGALHRDTVYSVL